MWYHESDPRIIVDIHQYVASVCTALSRQGIELRFNIDEPRSISEPSLRITIRMGEYSTHFDVQQHMIRTYGKDLRWLECSVQDMITGMVRRIICSSSSQLTKQK